MPSDAPHTDTVLAALASARERFRSAVVETVEELRGMLSDDRDGLRDPAEVLAAELGPFAAGRIDTGRLAALLVRDETLTADARRVMGRAHELLAHLLDEADEEVPFVVRVPSGGDLRDEVRDALARAGRAFGAARVADLARTGRYREGEHERLLEGLPARSWTAGERAVAPPLVVHVEGRDLRPAGLGDFLEGAQKIVLVVDGGGPVPPAALARLITPGVLVVQTHSAEGLAGIDAFAGPTVAALLPADAADAVAFVHDPRRGTLPWERLALEVDAGDVRERLEATRWKEGSWRSDLEHLVGLATSAGPSGGAGGADAAGGGVTESDDGAGAGPAAPEPTTNADRLAAWLLARTDLDEG